MELFRSVNIDWLGKKWYFLGFSLIFSVAGIISMGVHWSHHWQPGTAGRGLPGRHASAGAVCAASRYSTRSARPWMHRASRTRSIQNIRCGPGRERGADQPARAAQRDPLSTPGRQQIVDALHAHYDNPIVTVRQCAGGRSHGGQAVGKAGPAGHALLYGWACWSTSGSASS